MISELVLSKLFLCLGLLAWLFIGIYFINKKIIFVKISQVLAIIGLTGSLTLLLT